MTKTKKQRSSMMTIPQLRKAFDHIEVYTAGLLSREKDAKKRRRDFQDEWMKVFHRSVDDKSADAYLQFEAKKNKKSNKTRKQKGGSQAATGQRGGSALSGAPLDYSTRPGIYGVYGTFPEYISNGFATFGNATNKMAIQEGCNSAAEAAKFQAPYTGFGATSLVAQKGGKKSRKGKGKKGTRKLKGGAFPTISEFASAASIRPLSSSAPPSMAYTAVMDFKGSQPYPSALANGVPVYQGIKPMVITSTAGHINRALPLEL